MAILITGVAGFIGSKLALELLKDRKISVIGIDNLDNYYSVKLKKFRLNNLRKFKNFKFIKSDLIKKKDFKKINKLKKIDLIYHFAAQAGVRYTLSEPNKYFDNNIKAFFNLLEFCKNKKIKKVIFASSSSVYGDQKKYPVKESAKLNPKNIYGFTKKINEIAAKTFSKTFNCKMIGLRFFTVFGEWGRPDMLIFKYMKENISKNKFYLNEGGKHQRDFTYIGDVVAVLISLKKYRSKESFEIFNVCSNKPKKVKNIISKINKENLKFKYVLNKSENLNNVEVFKTHGNNLKIKKNIKNISFTDFNHALKKTVSWYSKNKIFKIT